MRLFKPLEDQLWDNRWERRFARRKVNEWRSRDRYRGMEYLFFKRNLKGWR